MANYPEWVLKYKKKGTYINVQNGKYYLYAAHSERVPGTKKVKRICDGYLGRITEEEGLIAPQDKLLVNAPIVHEYLFSAIILKTCANIHKGLRRSFVKYGDLVMVASILEYIYGSRSASLFATSSLSLRFPQLDLSAAATHAQAVGIERATLMIADTMDRIYSSDLPCLRTLCMFYPQIRISGKLYFPSVPPDLALLLAKYNLDPEVL